MAIQTIRYVPSDQQDAARQAPVSLVRVVSHTQFDGNTGPTNHCCLYFQTGPNSYIRLDMIPGNDPGTVLPGGRKGVLVVQIWTTFQMSASKPPRPL
ncbi:hypothetical protein A1O1_00891 [Capronia coronata CBS 617.96]|uniref:DUF7770 domain-containing protein n=1 Tax=Capronia coronata CBS 617.96 TaxID=1182541 RepID=W9YS83_9EURO|nr:uncharacterized protein A1O1_00891 [Capronia coronata CBS 617.96]EXJ95767.1 hypothetical protein A1O1_00891 [Capronia coronata CBS 617.96]